MSLHDIDKNIKELFSDVPDGVEIVAAAKKRSPEEIEQAIVSGIDIIGENYVQEAEKCFPFVKKTAKWHCIGHLQKNKVKKAVRIFDMIETVDSEGIASEINKKCGDIGKKMPILIEVNSGRETQKNGIFPEEVIKLIKEIKSFENISIKGLMTMGPFSGDPELSRPFFRETRRVFDEIKASGFEGVEMRFLSMGMTNSYKIAIEEGANMIRVGTKIFGERNL